MTSPRTMPVDPQLQSEGPNLLTEKGTPDQSTSSNSDRPGGEALSYGKARMRDRLRAGTDPTYMPSVTVDVTVTSPRNMLPVKPVDIN